MRLLIATGIFPPDIGGPATMLLSLTNGLIEKGIKVKVITYSAQNKKEIQPNGLEVFGIKKNTLFSKIKYFLKLLKLSKNSDLIYVTDTYSVGYFAYLLKKIFYRKYILRFTGDSAWETARTNGWTDKNIVNFQTNALSSVGSRVKSRIRKLVRRRNKILFNANKIIVDCEFNKQLAKLILDPVGTGLDLSTKEENKIIIINNAIYDVCHPERSGAEPSLPAGEAGDPVCSSQNIVQSLKQQYAPHHEKLLMTACRLTPWKGVDQIIEILPDLIKQIGPIKLLILGEGQEMENLKSLVQKINLENNVLFLGKINQDEIINYYRIADVFILNSQYEGMSNTLLEVMQAGVPIIASNSGGNPELIENNKEGILVEYNNHESLLNALLKILSTSICHPRRPRRESGGQSGDPVDSESNLVQSLTLNAQQKVQQFTLEKMIDKTMSLLLSPCI